MGGLPPAPQYYESWKALPLASLFSCLQANFVSGKSEKKKEKDVLDMMMIIISSLLLVIIHVYIYLFIINITNIILTLNNGVAPGVALLLPPG